MKLLEKLIILAIMFSISYIALSIVFLSFGMADWGLIGRILFIAIPIIWYVLQRSNYRK